MSYAGLNTAHHSDTPHLGGNIRGGDPFTWCPQVWNYVIDRFGISSVMDFGSGSGTTALYFHRKQLAVCAVDGLDENVKTAVFPTIKHDVTVSPFIGRFDLVHCQEVVEHIEERYLPNLMATFASAKFVLMTHALPGQLGFHHVNLQTSDYWIQHLKQHSFLFCRRIPSASAGWPTLPARSTWQRAGCCSGTTCAFDSTPGTRPLRRA